MSDSGPATKKPSRLNTLLAKTVLFAGLMTLSVLITKTWFGNFQKEELVNATMAERANEVTNLLSVQMGGAIRFENHDAVKGLTGEFIYSDKPDAVGALVLNSSGETVYASDGKGMTRPELMRLATSALEAGENVASEDGLTVATVSTSGAENVVVGVVLTQWTTEHVLADLQQGEREALMTSAIVFLFAMSGMGFYLWYAMSRPLSRVGSAMAEISSKNYDVTVPYTHRGDEVGMIASQLERFRESLLNARRLQRETAFKSAAFEGGSAPMMLVDEHNKIRFVNPVSYTHLTLPTKA